MQRYLRSQMKYIDDAKFFEGINGHYDPNTPYIMEWIEKNGAWFRDQWNKSCCSACINDCGNNLKPNCQNFKQGN